MRLSKENVRGFVLAEVSEIQDSTPCVKAVAVSKIKRGKNIGAGISWDSRNGKVCIYLVADKKSGRPECMIASSFITRGKLGKSIKVIQTSGKITVTLPMIFEFESKYLCIKD